MKKILFLTFITVFSLCLICYAWIDLWVAIYIHENLPSGIYQIFSVITNIGKAHFWFGVFGIPLIALLIYKFFTLHFNYTHYIYACWFGITSLMITGIFINILKVMIGRYRPWLYFNDNLYGFLPFNMDFGMNSFPSGHSQAIWSAMTIFALLFPKLPKTLLFGLASVVAISRVIIAQHFVSDVLMGSFIGFASTFLIYHYFSWRWGDPVLAKN